ncbi:response regulator, partial [bacterium]|nr:response regulator [bacterium]
INKEGIIGQFDGYFKLKELNWDAYRRKYDKVERMDRILKAEGKSPNDYKAAKQADVLMLFYLFPLFEIKDLFHRLGYRFDRYVLKRNYEYYVKRTSHGSSLSKIVHCYVAYLLGRSKEGWQWFSGVLKSDIYDVQGGTTVEGIHAGIMGGSIDMVVRGFAGIYMGEEIINITPNLPSNWQSLRFKFCYKGNWFSLFITKEQLTIFISGSPSKSLTVPVKIHGKLYHFLFRKKYTISLEKNIKGKGSLKMTQKRILIVDGNITQTERLKTKLQAMGYLIDCAHTGKEALDILETKWVDLIISAIIFQGGMNGFQFFKEVKKRKRLSKIPIAMQSSKAAMKGIFEIMGADTFFVKPYSMDLFLDEVKNILAGKALLSKSAQGRADK